MKKLWGRGTGEAIENVILRAKRELMIATPFISSEYAEMILDKASDGVKVRLITSPEGNDEKALEMLTEPVEQGFPYPVALSGLGALSVMMGVTFGIPVLTYLGVPLFLVALAYGSGFVKERQRENFEIRFVEGLKDSLYLNESEGVRGEVPLNPPDMWERINEVYVLEGNEVARAKSEFEELWRKARASS